LGRRACRKIGRGRPPTSVLLGAGKAVSQFDAGSHLEGLRIVATSTRVRLFPFPAGSRGRPSPAPTPGDRDGRGR
jgi:hypothetical protein